MNRISFSTSNPKRADYYSVLGVSKNSSQEDIKKAYFKKVKQFHPDVNKSPDANEKFKVIQEAYDTLGKPDRRRLYDSGSSSSSRYTRPGRGSGTTSQRQYNQKTYSNNTNSQKQTIFDENPFFDDSLFGQFFSSVFNSQKFQIQTSVSISFAESVTGCTKPITLRMLKKCTGCGGRGCQPGTSPITCPKCQGSGFSSRRQGNILLQMQCATCQGIGKVNANPCAQCSGSGNEHSTSSVNVNIPPGIDDGTVLNLSDQLNDVSLLVKVAKSKQFVRDGFDISSNLHIDFATAILGGHVTGETVYGPVNVKIPPGTDSHSKIRIPGKGVVLRGSNGDHVFDVRICTPTTISPEAKEMVTKLQQMLDLKAQTAKKNETTSSARNI